MFYVYVIRSKKDKRLYIGYTNDLRKRFKEHNEGENKSTKHRRPFELIYYEAYSSKRDAEIRETKIKQFKNSYSELKKMLKYSL